MSRTATDREGPTPGNGSSPSKKWRRRQRIEDLLASCSIEVLRLERGAAREVAASEYAARLIQARAAQTQPLPPAAPSSPSSPGTPPLQPPPHGLSAAVGGCPRTSGAKAADLAGNTADGDVLAKAHSLQAAAAAEPQIDTVAECASKRETAASISAELLKALAWDNTVLECNLQDYDAALSSTLEEVSRLKGEVREMESTCGQLGQLRQLLQHEVQVRSDLKNDNAKLHYRFKCLVAYIRQAAQVDEYDSAVSVDSLISEITTLRRILFSADAGSSKEAAAIGSRVLSGTASSGAKRAATRDNQATVPAKPVERERSHAAAAAMADSSADVHAEEIHSASRASDPLRRLFW